MKEVTEEEDDDARTHLMMGVFSDEEDEEEEGENSDPVMVSVREEIVDDCVSVITELSSTVIS